MKVAFIILSLALNAVLATFVVQRCTQPDPVTTTSTKSAFLTTLPPLSQAWNLLTSANTDATFLARLTAEGFPPRVIRLLLSEQIRARYADRLKALTAKDAQIPYWRTQSWSYDFNPETRAERRALERDISDEITKLLGPNYAEDESEYRRGERLRRFGSIPQDKITAIHAIQKDYSELSAQIRDASKGLVLAEDREKLAFLEKEKRSDLVRLLSPEELVQYDRRNSPAATTIRGQLRNFNPTEAEFLALYQAQRDFDALYGRDNLSGEQTDRRRAAQPELNAQFEAALGPERFAEYQITTDGNYSETRDFVKRLELPPETTKQLIRMQRELTQKAKALLADKSIPREQQTAQLALIEKEAQEKLTVTLGAENSTTYKEGSPGQWMSNLSPTSKTSTPR